MPIRNVATLATAIFLGLVAVVLVRNYVGMARQSGQPTAASAIPVVITAQAVPRGARLQPGMLKVVPFPTESVPAGTFPEIAEVSGAREGPRVALRSFAPNEILHAANVSAPGAKPNLSEALDRGMRAVSLKSDEVAGVAGFVLPGDRVDVLLTRAISGEKTDAVTQVLAENVMVLGVDQSNNEQAAKPVIAKAVTVQVTPDQAELISLGQSVGQVSLALRRAADNAPLAKRATTIADLGIDVVRKPARVVRMAPGAVSLAQAVAPTATPPAPETVVRVVRGVDATLYAGSDTSLTAVIGGRIRAAATLQPNGSVQP